MIGLTAGQQRGLFILLGLILAATFFVHLAGGSGRTNEALGVGVRVSGLIAQPGLYLFPHPPQVEEVLALAGAPETALAGEGPVPSGSWLVVGQGGVTRQKAPPAERLLLGLPLDVNAATAPELTLLPGVGPVLARRIVAARRDFAQPTPGIVPQLLNTSTELELLRRTAELQLVSLVIAGRRRASVSASEVGCL